MADPRRETHNNTSSSPPAGCGHEMVMESRVAMDDDKPAARSVSNVASWEYADFAPDENRARTVSCEPQTRHVGHGERRATQPRT